MKYIQLTTKDGSQWRVSLNVLRDHRASLLVNAAKPASQEAAHTIWNNNYWADETEILPLLPDLIEKKPCACILVKPSDALMAALKQPEKVFIVNEP